TTAGTCGARTPSTRGRWARAGRPDRASRIGQDKRPVQSMSRLVPLAYTGRSHSSSSKEPSMTRTRALALGLTLLTFMAGCGGDGRLGTDGAAVPAGGAQVEDTVQARGLGQGRWTMPRSLAEGRWQVFHTNEALVAADTNGTYDVYLQDLETGDVTLISQAGGAVGNRASYYASLSADGNRIAYASD